MLERIDAAGMTDLELTERYRSAQAGLRQLADQVRLAELEYSSKPSPESLDRLRSSRVALSRCPGGHPYRLEIIRRLNAPLKSVRLAKGLSQGEIAKRADLPTGIVQQIESGKYRANVQIALRWWNALELEYPHDWDSLDFT